MNCARKGILFGNGGKECLPFGNEKYEAAVRIRNKSYEEMVKTRSQDITNKYKEDRQLAEDLINSEKLDVYDSDYLSSVPIVIAET